MKTSFIHKHPFKPVVFKDTTKLIVGTLPPPRFSIKNSKLKKEDVLFCYGSADNGLWRILDVLYDLNLEFAPTKNAIQQRIEFLHRYKIGICDSVESAKREKIDASDNGMSEVVLRDLLGILQKHSSIDTLLLMGGASKNGPLYFVKKLLKQRGIKLEKVSDETPKIHKFEHQKRVITVVSLTSPSNAANRSIGANAHYKEQKAKDSSFSTFDFRLQQYRRFFPKA